MIERQKMTGNSEKESERFLLNVFVQSSFPKINVAQLAQLSHFCLGHSILRIIN